MQCIKSDCIPCQGTEPFARRPVGVRRGQRECKNILPAFFGTTCKCQWLFVTFHLSSLTRRYGSAHCMHTSSLILAVCLCKHLFLMFLTINKINLDYQLYKLSFEMLYVCILLVKKAIILIYFNPKLKRYVEIRRGRSNANSPFHKMHVRFYFFYEQQIQGGVLFIMLAWVMFIKLWSVV